VGNELGIFILEMVQPYHKGRDDWVTIENKNSEEKEREGERKRKIDRAS
jgi:hypothetical protein